MVGQWKDSPRGWDLGHWVQQLKELLEVSVPLGVWDHLWGTWGKGQVESSVLRASTGNGFPGSVQILGLLQGDLSLLSPFSGPEHLLSEGRWLVLCTPPHSLRSGSASSTTQLGQPQQSLAFLVHVTTPKK